MAFTQNPPSRRYQRERNFVQGLLRGQLCATQRETWSGADRTQRPGVRSGQINPGSKRGRLGSQPDVKGLPLRHLQSEPWRHGEANSLWISFPTQAGPSIRRVAALTPQQRQGWRFRQQRNNFISRFPCSEGARQRPWLRGGYSEVTPGSRARRSPRAVVASQLLFVREGKVLFALPALPRESAESCPCPGSPRAGIAFRECFPRGLGQSRGFWVLGELCK